MATIIKPIKSINIYGKGRAAVIFFEGIYEEVYDDYADLNWRDERFTGKYKMSVVHREHGYCNSINAGIKKDSFTSKAFDEKLFNEIRSRASKGKDGITYETLLSEMLSKDLIERLA